MFIALLAGLCCTGFALTDIDSGEKADIVARLNTVGEPFVTDKYLIFTAEKDTRFVGIAFGFEDYQTIYPFERHVRRDDEGTETSSLLFYILPLPKNTSKIDYRLVIDGLWTYDPLNSIRSYDPSANTLISSVYIEENTEKVSEVNQNGVIRFVHNSEPNQRIRIAGSFNNWDSFMYTLKEIAPGSYMLDLPLPKGSYYYSFYNGMSSFPDKSNPIRAYREDGTVVSYIKVD